jgi:hypothetical protein
MNENKKAASPIDKIGPILVRHAKNEVIVRSWEMLKNCVRNRNKKEEHEIAGEEEKGGMILKDKEG